jgi:hypothetical protein
MVNNLLLVPSLLIVTSCYAGATSINRVPNGGKSPCTVTAITKQADDTLVPYIEEFSDDAVKYGAACFQVKDVIISDTVKEGIAGYCQPRFAVVLSASYWKTASSWEKRTLVYHELAHCALDAGHVSEDDFQNIMNPYIIPDWIAERQWKELVRKLFMETPPS